MFHKQNTRFTCIKLNINTKHPRLKTFIISETIAVGCKKGLLVYRVRAGSACMFSPKQHCHCVVQKSHCSVLKCLFFPPQNGQTALLVAEGASQQDIIDLLKANAEVQTSESASTADLL